MIRDVHTPWVEPSRMMRAMFPHAGLVVFPACGRTPNLAEPDLFNRQAAELLADVEGARWAGWRR